MLRSIILVAVSAALFLTHPQSVDASSLSSSSASHPQRHQLYKLSQQLKELTNQLKDIRDQESEEQWPRHIEVEVAAIAPQAEEPNSDDEGEEEVEGQVEDPEEDSSEESDSNSSNSDAPDDEVADGNVAESQDYFFGPAYGFGLAHDYKTAVRNRMTAVRTRSHPLLIRDLKAQEDELKYRVNRELFPGYGFPYFRPARPLKTAARAEFYASNALRNYNSGYNSGSLYNSRSNYYPTRNSYPTRDSYY